MTLGRRAARPDDPARRRGRGRAGGAAGTEPRGDAERGREPLPRSTPASVRCHRPSRPARACRPGAGGRRPWPISIRARPCLRLASGSSNSSRSPPRWPATVVCSSSTNPRPRSPRPKSTRLFGHLRRLRDQGIGVLYITHRLDEIQRLADRVTVLRDGRVVDTRAASDLDHASLGRTRHGIDGRRQGPRRDQRALPLPAIARDVRGSRRGRRPGRVRARCRAARGGPAARRGRARRELRGATRRDPGTRRSRGRRAHRDAARDRPRRPARRGSHLPR